MIDIVKMPINTAINKGEAEMSVEIMPKCPEIRWEPNHLDDYARIDDVLRFVFDEETKARWPIDVRAIYYDITMNHDFQHSTHWFARSGKNKGKLMTTMADNVGEIVTWLRHNEGIPWEAITDDQRNVSVKVGKSSPYEYIEESTKCLFRSWSTCLAQNQPNYIEVWVEKNGLFRTCEIVADKYCRRVVSCKGYQSQTFLHEYAERADKEQWQGRSPVILYFGDYNIEGMNIAQAIADSLVYDHAVSSLSMIRCGLNKEHIRGIQASPSPLKGSPNEKREFIAEYGDEAYELNALGLAGVDRLVEKSIQEWTDMELLRADHKAGAKLGKKFNQLHFKTVEAIKANAKELQIIN